MDLVFPELFTGNLTVRIDQEWGENAPYFDFFMLKR